MSQTNQQPGGSASKNGCTPAVIAFTALAILFFGAAAALFVFSSEVDDSLSLNEATTRVVELAQEVASNAADADSQAPDGVALEDAIGEADNPSVAVEEDGVAIEEAIGEAENPAVGVAPDGDGVEPDQAPGEPESPVAVADPEPEGTSVVPELIDYGVPQIGLAMTVRDYYSYGTMVDRPDPYSFAKPGSCGMRVDVYPIPTAELPGATTLDAVNSVFQSEVASSSSSYTWNPLGPAYELELNDRPAARLEVERVGTDDKRSFFQYSVIRGDARSAVVIGQIGNKCGPSTGAENLPALSALTDTVRLTPSLPVCYVGKVLGDEEDYSVACDQWGGSGDKILMQGDHPEVVLGPVTWDECAQFMREHNQVGWVES